MEKRVNYCMENNQRVLTLISLKMLSDYVYFRLGLLWKLTLYALLFSMYSN